MSKAACDHGVPRVQGCNVVLISGTTPSVQEGPARGRAPPSRRILWPQSGDGNSLLRAKGSRSVDLRPTAALARRDPPGCQGGRALRRGGARRVPVGGAAAPQAPPLRSPLSSLEPVLRSPLSRDSARCPPRGRSPRPAPFGSSPLPAPPPSPHAPPRSARRRGAARPCRPRGSRCCRPSPSLPAPPRDPGPAVPQSE